jgi:diguanylate cyclase (GGDEF)-like protein
MIEAPGEERASRLAALTQAGYEVIAADTISAGISILGATLPDLIVCGVELSGGDNLELLRYLQQQPGLLAIPVILLTSLEALSHWRQCIMLGADDCLIVPFTHQELIDAIAIRLLKQDGLTQRYNTLMRPIAERLNRLAHYDSLTDLPNYQLLRQRLQQAIERAANDGYSPQRVALMTVSLDRLRQVNNTLGYAAGDSLLKAMAQRLVGIVPRASAVARLTANQFAIVVPAPPDRNTLRNLALTIFNSVSHSFALLRQEVFATISIGIALFPDDSTEINVLLRQADAALDRAKQQKSNSYQFYRVDMPMVSGDELQLETWLRYALERQEFEVRYQPQYSLSQQRIVGAEALIRWQHVEADYISPGRFIPLAEDTGLIVPIGNWVLRTVCRQAADWLNAGYPLAAIAVNLSSVQLNQADFVQLLKRLLTETQLPPAHLKLEVTETALMQNIDSAVALLQQLKILGVQIAIDDFGTGYASLSYLRQLPIDILKIDASFIRNLHQEPKNQAIVKHIIAMAHDLDLQVIAEGVELAAEAETLAAYGCDYIQGYWIASPLSAAALIADPRVTQ